MQTRDIKIPMKSVIYKKFGDEKVLELSEEDIPSPLVNQVQVKIKYVSYNPVDKKIRLGELSHLTGSKFPRHICTEFSGTISQLGNNVNNFKIGDDVFGALPTFSHGCLSEYITISISSIIKIPNSITNEIASTIPVAGSAAYQTVYDICTNLEPDMSVLINGCTGGLGLMATQMFKLKKVRVVGTCSTANLALAKEYGCDEVIDYRKSDPLRSITEEKFDVVLDCAHTWTYKKSKHLLKKYSRFIDVSPNLTSVLLSPIRSLWIWSQSVHVVMSEPTNNKSLEKITQLIVSNGLKIHIHKIFKFAEFVELFSYGDKGGYPGKVIITFE